MICPIGGRVLSHASASIVPLNALLCVRSRPALDGAKASGAQVELV